MDEVLKHVRKRMSKWKTIGSVFVIKEKTAYGRLRSLVGSEMCIWDRTWPREIPLAGEPADVVAIVREYGAWMAGNDMPKLFVNADPGAILVLSLIHI